MTTLAIDPDDPRFAEPYWVRRAAGLCGKCGGPGLDDGMAVCGACRSKRVAAYHERRASGLCVRCGGRSAQYAYCDDCAA